MARNLRGLLDPRLEVFQPLWEGVNGLSKTPPTGFTGRIFYGPAVDGNTVDVAHTRVGGIDFFPSAHTRFRSEPVDGNHLIPLPPALTRFGGEVETVVATGPLGTNTLTIDKRTGVVTSWLSALNGQSAVELLNRGNGYTRGIQPYLEWSDARPESEGRLVRHKALLGGSYLTRADVNSAAYFLGNPSIEITQRSNDLPALNTSWVEKGGTVQEVRVSISGYAMEYDPDGQHSNPGVSTFHGGLHGQVAMWKILMGLDIVLNKWGVEGLHQLVAWVNPEFKIKTAYFDAALSPSIYLNRGAFTAQTLSMMDPGLAEWSGGNWDLALGDHVPAFHSVFGNRWEGAVDSAAASHHFRGFVCAGTAEASTYAKPCVYLFSHLDRQFFLPTIFDMSRSVSPTEAVLVQSAGGADGHDGSNYLHIAMRRAYSARWASASGPMLVFPAGKNSLCSNYMSVYPRQADIGAAETDGGLKLAVQAYRRALSE